MDENEAEARPLMGTIFLVYCRMDCTSIPGSADSVNNTMSINTPYRKWPGSLENLDPLPNRSAGKGSGITQYYLDLCKPEVCG